jgi:hypothetical protein
MKYFMYRPSDDVERLMKQLEDVDKQLVSCM